MLRTLMDNNTKQFKYRILINMTIHTSEAIQMKYT